MIESLVGALVGGAIAIFSAWLFRRRTSDALAEDIFVKTNDELRKVFTDNEIDYKPYTIRFVLGDRREYLVSRIIRVGAGTVVVDYMQIMDDNPMRHGQALFRLSAIETLNDNDDNRHANKHADTKS